MALIDNLISYWKMDEASGDAVDSHGTNTLTDQNTVGSAAGKINNGRDFERDSVEHFTHTDNASLSTGDIDFTFAFWFKPETVVDFEWILAKDDLSSNRDYGFYSDASGTVYFYVVTGSSVQVPSNVNISAGTWYHIVGWHDSVNNEIGIAINAGTAATQAHSLGVNDTTAGFCIGGASGTNTADGIIDEVGFWKRVLTSQERTDLYNGGAGLAYGSFGGAAAIYVGSMLALFQ